MNLVAERANLRVAISATQFMERLKDFPWPERVLKLDELIPRLKRQIVFWWIVSLSVPARLLLRSFANSKGRRPQGSGSAFYRAEPPENQRAS
jgi:hypothetical protein